METFFGLLDSDQDGTIDSIWLWAGLAFAIWLMLIVVKARRKRQAPTNSARIREHRMKGRG